MPPAEGEKRPDHRTAITVAVIGLIGVLASPLVPLIWDYIFSRSRAPEIEEFSVSPQRIREGEKVLLRWRVKDADHVEIQPGLPEASIPHGSWEDRPGRSTLYILTASGRSGKDARRSVGVEVAPRPPGLPPPTKGPPVTPPPKQEPQLTMIYEPNVDRPDATWDIGVLRVGTRDHRACDELCLRRPDCKSYVYMKPGVREPDAVCVLKSELPIAVLNQPCCITGVVKERALKP